MLLTELFLQSVRSAEITTSLDTAEPEESNKPDKISSPGTPLFLVLALKKCLEIPSKSARLENLWPESTWDAEKGDG